MTTSNNALLPDLGTIEIPTELGSDSVPMLRGFISLDDVFRERADAFALLRQELTDAVSVLGASTKHALDELQFSIAGPVLLAADAEILPGTRIEGPVVVGPRSTIGPSAYIRGPSVLGARVRLGFCAEVKCSLLFDGVVASHYCYAGHSLIGEASILGAGTTLAARRLDDAEVALSTPHGLVTTKHAKFGAVIERGSRTGVQTAVMPGAWVPRDSRILPMSLVKGLHRPPLDG